MDEKIQRVLNVLTVDFFKGCEEAVTAAFQEAHLLSKQRFDQPEQTAMLGQTRHALSEAGFRHVAEANGLAVHADQTEPAGGMFSWASGSNGVHVLRANIQQSLGLPRPSRFRKEFSAMNEWLDPVQPDFFLNVPTPPSDRICLMLVTTAFRPALGQPGCPAFVGFGIPDADLNRWHFIKPVHEWLAMCHDSDTKSKPVTAAPVILKDIVQPRLKKDRPQKG